MEGKKDTLKNGVRLLTVPMPHLGSVTAMIGFGAGSRYETKKTQGIAHFTEHMMFDGTERRPTTFEISSELDALGAQFNAFTAQEMTAYYAKAAAKNLPQILDILADMVFNSKFDPKEIERESKVIIEELRMYKDEPKSWVYNLYEELLYGDHPLGRLILGTEETLAAISREDFLAYLKQWYLSKNLVVAVAGKIGEKEALAEIREVLGGLPAQDAGKPEPFKPFQKEPGVMLENRKTDQTHLILGARAYPRSHPQREALEVLVTILGGGMSSRLVEQIRVQRGLAYYVGADWDNFSDAGSVVVSAGVNNQKVDDVIQVALEELAKLKEIRVEGKELQKAQEMLRGHIVLGIESTNGACSYFITQEI
ncbi:MAG: pitrilysin family protein, partial [bacterium]|nr:pitrilysin family protein [bacterium]